MYKILCVERYFSLEGTSVVHRDHIINNSLPTVRLSNLACCVPTIGLLLCGLIWSFSQDCFKSSDCIKTPGWGG